MALRSADFLRVPFINLLNPGSQWRESVVKLWIFQRAFQYRAVRKKKCFDKKVQDPGAHPSQAACLSFFPRHGGCVARTTILFAEHGIRR